MNLDELIPAPNAQKVSKIAKRVFGYSLDLENITESKAKKLHKNLSTQMSLYESQLGSRAQKRTKYYEMKLALEALTKHLDERMVDEEDVEEANAFNTARDKAIADGKGSFSFNGKTYKITGKGADDENRQKDGFGERVNEAKATWPKSDDDESAPDIGDTVMHDKHGLVKVLKITDRDMMMEPAEYIVQTKRGKKRISFDQLVMGESITESPAGNALQMAYDKVYNFVGEYDDEALEYLDDNAPTFSEMADKYDYEFDVMAKELDANTLKVVMDELHDVAVDFENGVLESKTGELKEGPGESDLHHMDFDKVDKADLNTMSEIVAEYVNENMQDLPQSAAYSYDVIIDVDMNEDVNESKQITEGAVETSELVMAAKSMVDKYDQMIKDISEMANEDLAPVADKVRDEMGSDVADNFTNQMTAALESTLAIMKADRANAESATRILVGDQPAKPMGDEVMADEPEMEPTIDQDADDDFAAADAAMGGEDAEVGREKRA